MCQGSLASRKSLWTNLLFNKYLLGFWEKATGSPSEGRIPCCYNVLHNYPESDHPRGVMACEIGYQIIICKLLGTPAMFFLTLFENY